MTCGRSRQPLSRTIVSRILFPGSCFGFCQNPENLGSGQDALHLVLPPGCEASVTVLVALSFPASNASRWTPSTRRTGPERSEGNSLRGSTTAVLPKTKAGEPSTLRRLPSRIAEPYSLAPKRDILLCRLYPQISRRTLFSFVFWTAPAASASIPGIASSAKRHRGLIESGRRVASPNID